MPDATSLTNTNKLLHEVLPISKENLWTNIYQKKFKKLGSELAPGFTTKIAGAFRNLFQRNRIHNSEVDDQFAINTFIGAEHLSNSMYGSTKFRSAYAFGQTSSLLDSVSPNPLLSRQLRDAKVLYSQTTDQNEIPKTSKKVHKKLLKLKKGESLIVPSYSQRHAMILHITCTEDLNGQRKYKCVQHNEGNGVEAYHYSKIDERGNILYQTALEIENISEENLSASFFEKLIQCQTKAENAEEVYEVLKQLGGTILPPSDDARLWSPGQVAGSCAGRCILSLVRSQLTPENYNKFIQAAQYELVFKTVEEIRRGRGNLRITRIVGLEAINQLENAHRVLGGNLPIELANIRENLNLKGSAKTNEGLVSYAPAGLSDNLTQTMETAFKSLEEWMSTNVANDRVELDMTKALERFSSPNPITRDEAKELMKFYKDVRFFFDKYKLQGNLTLEQTYMMTAFASIMVKTLNFIDERKVEWNLNNEEIKDIMDVQAFAFNLHVRFNRIECGKWMQHQKFDAIIRDVQNELFQSGKQITPSKLEQWKESSLASHLLNEVELRLSNVGKQMFNEREFNNTSLNETSKMHFYLEKDGTNRIKITIKNINNQVEQLDFNLKGTYEETIEAVEKLIMEILNKQAEAKSFETIFELAERYAKGKGVEIDLKQAFTLFKLASDKGYAPAQIRLGLCYELGSGVEKNLKLASKYYQLAANQNNAKGQSYLGECYLNGKGVKIDLEKAVEYFQLAEKQGETSAQYYLWYCYKYGFGLSKNESKSIELLKKAASKGYAPAQFYLGTEYEKDEKDAEYRDKAIELYQLAAAQGDLEAQTKLASLGIPLISETAIFEFAGKYARGDGVPKDLKQAFKLYQIAANKGYPPAQFQLGLCYESGNGVKEDFQEAIKCYKLAADQSNVNGLSHLGAYYLKGVGVKPDFSKAVECLIKASNLGEPRAKYNLALCYNLGYGVPKDLTKSNELFKQAAENKYAPAQFYLGKHYENGIGFEKNMIKAIEFYQLAADQGDENAIKRLEQLNKIEQPLEGGEIRT